MSDNNITPFPRGDAVKLVERLRSKKPQDSPRAQLMAAEDRLMFVHANLHAVWKSLGNCDSNSDDEDVCYAELSLQHALEILGETRMEIVSAAERLPKDAQEPEG